MDSESVSENEVVEVVLEAQSIESTEEPPMDEWSSLQQDVPQINLKRIAYEQGKYDPGPGEPCLSYIPMSDSAIFRHVYYKYPAVLDPGIESALLDPIPAVIYSDDGQDLYLDLCKEMNQCPITLFHKALLNSTVDLSYYYINPVGVRAIAMALQNNTNVKVLNLTDNFLTEDACYHLGQLLAKNNTIEELNLEGCRIRASGLLRILSGLVSFIMLKKKPKKRPLRILNLNRNELGDDGGERLAEAFERGLAIEELYLSYNGLGTKTTAALAEGMEYNNVLSVLDLSWNNLFSPLGTCQLLNRLQENENLRVLNLAWDTMAGPRISTAIKNVLLAPKLTDLNLSNNNFEGDAITNIVANLNKAKKLVTLNLSFNPMSTTDTAKLLTKLKTPAVKIKTLLMDNVVIDGTCMDLIKTMKQMRSKKNVIITHGEAFSPFKGVGPDPREIVLNRAEYLAKKPKKKKVDIALIAYQLEKDGVEITDIKTFNTAFQRQGFSFDEGLLDYLSSVFPGPSTKKAKYINVPLLADYMRRKWPERKLPPTPPPEPEPEPEPLPPPPKGKDAKGKDLKGKDVKGKK